jgi:hypothetical protein
MCPLPAVIWFWVKNSQKQTLIQVSGKKISAFFSKNESPSLAQF